MKICIITAKTPFSSKETFILEEIFALDKICDLLISPRDVKGKVVKGAEGLNVLATPLFSVKAFASFFLIIFTKDFWKIIQLIFSAGNKRTIPKNLVVFPKSIYLSRALRAKGIEHIHAHWGGTTGTMALIIHLLTGIPFSVTFHRWDIGENNLAKEKVAEAKFVRAISDSGKKGLESLLPSELHKKIAMIHLGVKIPENTIKNTRTNALKVINVGNLVAEKGQEVFLRSLKILKDKNIKFQADIFGDGPLENYLKHQSINLGISDCVEFRGRIAHQKLLKKYANGDYNSMVLTSFMEGIPVALMEAMAYGIPVIANDVGGIAELIKDGENGFLIHNNSPKQIAKKIILLSANRELTSETKKCARAKVAKHFNVSTTAQELLKMIS